MKEDSSFISGLSMTIPFLMSWVGRALSVFNPRAKHTEQQDWTLDRTGISLVTARTENGSISLEGSDQSQVTVHAWKEVRAYTEVAAEEFARQIEIHVERHGDEIRIYKEHPKPPRGINVSVRYEIQSPSTVRVNLRTSNGKIWINGVKSEVDTETSNGAIELQGGTGRIQARTSNGKIEASVETLQQEGVFSTSNGSINVKILKGVAPVSATTHNGSIDMTLPADFPGQLDARTSNGHVHSEFPVTVTEGSKNHLIGQIGAGGETTVKLRTSNGSIHLRVQQ